MLFLAFLRAFEDFEGCMLLSGAVAYSCHDEHGRSFFHVVFVGDRVVDVFDKDFSFEFNGGRGAEGFSCLGLVGNDVDGGVGKVSGKNGESGFYGSAVGPLAGDGHGDGAGVYVVALKGHVEVFSFAQHLVFELQRDGGFDGASVVHDVLQSLDARVADIDAACDAALLLKVFVGKQHGAELRPLRQCPNGLAYRPRRRNGELPRTMRLRQRVLPAHVLFAWVLLFVECWAVATAFSTRDVFGRPRVRDSGDFAIYTIRAHLSALVVLASMPDYNPGMSRLNSTQQKSMAAAIVLVVGVLLSYASGKAFIPSEVLTDQVLSNIHHAERQAVTLAPGDEVASLGLRHTVPTALEEAVLVDVVDGDSIDVLVGGKEKTVRMIGINTPEAGGTGQEKGTAEGAQAANHLRMILHVGDVVYLQKDTTDSTKNGQLLRFVWIAKPTSFTDVNEVRAKMLNAKMLAEGYGVAHKDKPNDAYFTIFKASQLEAYHADKGLWAEGTDWSYAI